MIVLRVMLFLAGAAIVVLVVRSVIGTFVVPRPLRTYFARAVFVLVRRIFRLRANERHDYAQRDRVMAFYAPVGLVVVLASWVAILLAAFTMMFFAIEDVSGLEAFAIAGSSLFTLGFASRDDLPSVALSFVAAGVGLTVLALFITYLPATYVAFQRRERGVSKLEVRAGSPPSGVYLIDLAWRVGRFENLPGLWTEWEDWFTDVDESHGSFPALAHFRSPHPEESWITAAGAVLDAASLFDSIVDVPRIPEPQFMIRSGYLCLRHLAAFFRIPVEDDPRPDDPSRSRARSSTKPTNGCGMSAFRSESDRERGWRDFAGWRVNYDEALVGLARLTMAPPAPWSSDRYDDVHYVPPAFPGRRRGPRR